MISIAVIFAIGYFLLLVWVLYGWLRLKAPLKTAEIPEISFSIIVPARNEENNIITTIEDLAAQNYPPELFEVIILDDDSDDQTYNLALEWINNFNKIYPNFKLIRLNKDDQIVSGHKKRAIETGINQSKNDWIVTTDADCKRGQNWLNSIAGIITQLDPVLVSAPVTFYDEKSLFQKMQSLEFLSLVGMGAASISNGSPNLCNGANLAYKKSVFYEVGGFSDNLNLSSGDDEFLLHKIAPVYPGKITFLKDLDACVYTKPPKTVSDFIRQRQRWVSKSTKYRKKKIIAILFFVYVFHFLIFTTGIIYFVSAFFLLPFIILIIAKIFSEILLVIPLSFFFRKLRFLPLYPFAAIFYIIYVVSIGFIGNSGRYVWKGRKVT